MNRRPNTIDLVVDYQFPELAAQCKSDPRSARTDFYWDLHAEALYFVSTTLGRQEVTAELTEDEALSLNEHLASYWKKMLWDRYGSSQLASSKETLVSDLRTESAEKRSDDELLSTRSGAARELHKPDEQDSEQVWSRLESERDRLRGDLPLLEYEALQLRTQNEVDRRPRLTQGFEAIGIQMLVRRARIRMLWDDAD